ncbi:MAG TPA: nuclear transport factor 2 family protein [Candidatus Kapabacteria bacterium]|jgi:ketosteroid isomerase-like protein
MTTETMATDDEQIRNLLHQWAETTRKGQLDDVLANHTSDAIIFDVLPPMKYEGTDAYRKSWGEWQPNTVEMGHFDLHDLQVTAGSDVAFAHCFIRCGGTFESGKQFEDWVRATFCLRKINDRWLVEHQHISMPRK